MSALHNSNLLLFKHLTDETLNELLNRINENILYNDIINEISGLPISIKPFHIKIKINKTVDLSNNKTINVYINYFNKNIQFGHISLHLTGFNTSSKFKGLVHMKNNINNVYNVLLIQPSVNTITIKLPSITTVTDNNIILFTQHILNVINKYLSKNQIEPLSLLNKRTQNIYKHQYLENILSIRNYTSSYIPRRLSKKTRRARKTETVHRQGPSAKPKSKRKNYTRYNYR